MPCGQLENAEPISAGGESYRAKMRSASDSLLVGVEPLGAAGIPGLRIGPHAEVENERRRSFAPSSLLIVAAEHERRRDCSSGGNQGGDDDDEYHSRAAIHGSNLSV